MHSLLALTTQSKFPLLTWDLNPWWHESTEVFSSKRFFSACCQSLSSLLLYNTLPKALCCFFSLQIVFFVYSLFYSPYYVFNIALFLDCEFMWSVPDFSHKGAGLKPDIRISPITLATNCFIAVVRLNKARLFTLSPAFLRHLYEPPFRMNHNQSMFLWCRLIKF